MAQFLNSGGTADELEDMADFVVAKSRESGFRITENFKLIGTVEPVANRCHLYMNEETGKIILFEEDNRAEEYTLEQFAALIDKEESDDETTKL
jgi:hypothetical protein